MLRLMLRWTGGRQVVRSKEKRSLRSGTRRANRKLSLSRRHDQKDSVRRSQRRLPPSPPSFATHGIVSSEVCKMSSSRYFVRATRKCLQTNSIIPASRRDFYRASKPAQTCSSSSSSLPLRWQQPAHPTTISSSRTFSSTASQRHGHLDPPKPGEE